MRILQGAVAGVLMLFIVVAGLWVLPTIIQLMPGERPGICATHCY